MKNKTIYLIRSHEGEYGDYYCTNMIAFICKDRAKEYIKELERKEKKDKAKNLRKEYPHWDREFDIQEITLNNKIGINL